MVLPRKPLPPQDFLAARLVFIDGIAHWRARPREDFKDARCHTRFNRRFPGRPAGHDGPNGYVKIRINGDEYALHRIVWKLVYGTEPENIDHINGDRADNRPENLRQATQSQNFFNAVRPKNNTSGYKGVCRYGSRWQATIGDNGRARRIGIYDTKIEAAEAYFLEAQRIAGEFARRG